MPNTCCVGFYHLLHIGPGVFEVTSASEGLLLGVVEMEKERKGRGNHQEKKCTGKKGDCSAGVNLAENERCRNLSPLPESLGVVGGGCLVCFLFEVKFPDFLGATEKQEWASESPKRKPWGGGTDGLTSSVLCSGFGGDVEVGVW